MRLIFAIIWTLLIPLAHGQVKDVVSGSYTPGFYSVQNFIKNPNCFANTKFISVTATGTITRNTTTPLASPADCQVGGVASADKVTFAGRVFDTALKGQNCEFKFTYAGDASKWKVYAYSSAVAASQSLQLESTIDPSSITQSKTASVLYPCGSASSAVDLVFEATAGTPGNFKVTGLQSGLATNMASVAQARIIAEAYIPSVSSCSWGNSTSAYTDFSAVAACPAATIVSGFTGVEDLPQVTYTGLPPGRYELIAEIPKFETDASGETGCIRLSDGTNLGTPKCHTDNNVDTVNADLRLSFTTSSTSSPTFKIQGMDVQVYNNLTTQSGSVRFILKYYPNSSQVILSPEQRDTDWVNFTPTGGWTTNATYTGKWRRVGDEMEIQYKVATSTTPTGSTLYFNMPSGYTIDTSKILDSTNGIQGLGTGVANDVSVANYDIIAKLNSSTQIDIYRSQTSTGTNPVHVQTSNPVTTSAPFAFAAGDSVSVKVKVPITGWIKSGVIAGSLNDAVNSIGSFFGADLQSVYFGSGATCATACTTGTCTICNQIGTKITSVTWVATGGYRANGIDGTKYNCVALADDNSGYTVMRHSRVSSTTSYATFTNGTAASATNAQNASMICFGKP